MALTIKMKDGTIERWGGIWKTRKNSKKTVCTFAGQSHAGLNDPYIPADYLRTIFCRKANQSFDEYRLPKGYEIID